MYISVYQSCRSHTRNHQITHTHTHIYTYINLHTWHIGSTKEELRLVLFEKGRVPPSCIHICVSPMNKSCHMWTSRRVTWGLKKRGFVTLLYVYSIFTNKCVFLHVDKSCVVLEKGVCGALLHIWSYVTCKWACQWACHLCMGHV